MKRSATLALALLIIFALFLSSVPYMAGFSMQRPGERFTGLTWNIDDACVYLSWIRQVADGHVLFRNNFTNDAQHGRQFNLLFALMGVAVRATRLSPTAVFHIFRILFGAGLLLMAWKLARVSVPDERKRLFFLGVLAFSSGFGWLLPERGHQGPVDTWQPEAITFLSLYLNPLFLAGQILLLAALYFLMGARRTGRLRPAVYAGAMLLLLANIHSYDVVTSAGIWGVYLIVLCVVGRKLLWRVVGLSALAGAIALPALGYQFYLYRTEEVFRLRANTPAPSPAVWSYFLGYGVIFIAAIFALPRAIRNRKHLLLVVWAVVGFVLPYLPFAQQRKLVMGLHFPLAMLCAMALWPLAKRFSWRNARALGWAFIAFAAIGNLYFLRRDINWLARNRTATVIHRPFLMDSEIRALNWLRTHTRRSDVVFAGPDIALFVPAISGNVVYYGHWSETPDYAARMRQWFLFSDRCIPEAGREAILRASRAAYVLESAAPSNEPVGYLNMVHRDGEVAIYRVSIPHTGRTNSAKSNRRRM